MDRQKVFQGNAISPVVTYKDMAAHFALLGTDGNGSRAQWPIGADQLSKHMLLLGGIGTGKSNTFYQLTKQIRRGLTNRDVMIVFDTKGDFYNEFYQPGDIVISNDARATAFNRKDYWNLFGEIMIDDRQEENTLEITKTIFSEKLTRTTQPFFPNAAKDLLMALILHLIRSDKCLGKRNNQSLRDILNDFSVDGMMRILAAHPDLRAMQSYISDPHSGQTLGVISELQQMVREVLVGNFAKQGSLSMRKLVREKGGKVIFVEYDLGIGNMLSPIYRLLFDLAIKEALCRTANEGNVYFMIDEFRLLPHLEHIDDGVNFGRSLGAKFIVGVQNIEQIFDAYGEERARSILSGFGTLMCFRLNDGTTRSYVQEIFGRNVSLNTFESSVKNRGIVEQLRETSVVEDWDVTRLGLGEALVGYAEYPPFRFRFQKYAP